jgi:hypothetical protein
MKTRYFLDRRLYFENFNFVNYFLTLYKFVSLEI